MTARSDLADLVRPRLPDSWHIADYADSLRTTDTVGGVAVVIEQTQIAAGETSADGKSVFVVCTLQMWVVVDGTRGDLTATIEDTLDDALERVIWALSDLPRHTWDGTAERTNYDAQKPAYRLTITAPGTITEPAPIDTSDPTSESE